MSTRIRIDRLRLTGIDERTVRDAMALLPALLARAVPGRSLVNLRRNGMQVDVRGSSAHEVARAIAEALLRGQS